MSDITSIVESVLAENKEKVAEYHSVADGEESVQFFVGSVMTEAVGEFTHDEIREEVVNQLESAEDSVTYPVELDLYHQYDETALAERLAGKLRDELDVPLENVDVPNSFSLPEFQVTYQIHSDGTVEIVERDE